MPIIWDKACGERLADRMTATGYTFRKLGEDAGVSTGTLQNWAHGRGQPHPLKLAGVADQLKCDPAEFFGRASLPKTVPSPTAPSSDQVDLMRTALDDARCQIDKVMRLLDGA